MGVVRERASAKVNLTLAVRGRRPDGYHELMSLVAFADLGDELVLDPRGPAAFRVVGPFAAAIEGENLVARACGMVEEALKESSRKLSCDKAHDCDEALDNGCEALGGITLEKQLPVAAGLGGGSSDAAAFLRAFARGHPREASKLDLPAIAARLGADVPVCLVGRAAWMWGLGERVMPLAGFPTIDCVLVNPRVPLATSKVFAALGARPLGSEIPEPPKPHAFLSPPALFDHLGRHGNDLEAVAMALAPIIGDVLEMLRGAPGCRYPRLSGSGPTCVGFFDDAEAARRAARRIAERRPAWWVRACRLR